MKSMKMGYLLTAMLVLLLLSCGSDTQELFPESITFDNDKVKHIHLTGGEVLELSPPMRVLRFRVHDTLFIASGLSPVNDYRMHIYSLNSGKHITSFAKHGRGPGEIHGVSDFQLLSGGKELFFPDLGFRRTWSYSLDSILLGSKQPVIESISFADSLYDVEIMLDARQYLSRYTFSRTKLGKKMFTKHSLPSYHISAEADFPIYSDRYRNIGGRHMQPIFYSGLSYSPEKGLLVAAFVHTDLIEVYDVNLERKVRIHGPDRFFPEFFFVPPGGLGSGGLSAQNGSSQLPQTVLDNIVYPSGVARNGYRFPVALENGFYVSYNGKIKPIDSNERVFPEIVYNFRYDGTPVCRYTFDMGGFSLLQVDDKEEKIYLTDPLGEIHVYRLKQP